MPWVSEEQIQELKQIRAYEYLKEKQPRRLKKTRTVNEWELTDHDSFKINEVTSKWHWKSRDIGGVSALKFLMQVDGYSFMEAVSLLPEGNLYPARSSTTGEETVCAAGKEHEQPQDPAIPVRERHQRGRHPALPEIGNPL